MSIYCRQNQAIFLPETEGKPLPGVVFLWSGQNHCLKYANKTICLLSIFHWRCTGVCAGVKLEQNFEAWQYGAPINNSAECDLHHTDEP